MTAPTEVTYDEHSEEALLARAEGYEAHAKRCREQAAILRAQKQEQRGPFGLVVNEDGYAVVSSLVNFQVRTGGWELCVNGNYSPTVELAEAHAIRVCDAILKARGMVAELVDP